MQMCQNATPRMCWSQLLPIEMLQPVRISAVAQHPLKISQPKTGIYTLKVLIFNTVQCFTFVLYLRRGKGKKRQHSALMDCIDKFVEYQSAARSEFLEWEERRQKREEDMEETRRREERDHELRLFQLLAGTHSSSPACPSYSYQCQQGGNDLPEN